ncbi:cell division protein SepF [Anaerosporobacter faecicola]|uniref:cell division protein SepF n=1 Tax=Anaerosporobacter faecicola TaxID=2718714 RepID=UPI001439E10A|nr:cell division protein SepF [Anaerosporobacter faecicola]
MANILKNFLGYLKLGEDDDYDDYVNDYDEKEEEREEKRRSRRESSEERMDARPERSSRLEKMPTRSYINKDKDDEELHIPVSETRKERTQRLERERGSANKVVPIRTTAKGLEVCIMKPTSFEDSQDICDMLLTGRAAVVNLEGFDPLEAQRIMDFISGCVYAINGKLHQISRYIFIFSPDSVDISGDYLDLVPNESFGVPTINKEF